MIASSEKRPEVEADHFECVVLDVRARSAGFYATAWRTYYVGQNGAVYLLRAPGQRAMLHQEDDLPADAEPAPGEARDHVLQHLAAAVEALTRRTGGPGVQT